MAKTWLITGASRGFGREWTVAALERGDNVAATVRDASSIGDLASKYPDQLLPVTLDVRDRAAVFGAVQAAHEHFGRLDVVVNNAGYGHFGYVEETTESEAREQFEANFFGLLWVTQAALPLLRAQGSGHLLQVSSVSGLGGAPSLGLYSASKFAVEGLCESLAAEVAPFGIKVTIIEPGGYATDWAGSSAVRSEPLEAYQPLRDQMAQVQASAQMPAFPGPEATTQAVFAVVDHEEPPLRLLLSSMALGIAVSGHEQRIAQWQTWADVSRSAD
ncbi:SDR family NAD(P)-dependent oxidoreductase [Kineosporia babensis]|uniref:SDR family NAD(P)-dependent oxidoreductase n=1 Tax=Kineosporia babensis TaxID=499548 RepID=A0A9X1NMT3_9ACTN|nr:SDR family NAD(P)-dependent oxidoreductase [Kineosporia babensis]MCD5316634.1 SDR family NAD(P)-dependent oxidoreductase [Kineosporia babensis]